MPWLNHLHTAPHPILPFSFSPYSSCGTWAYMPLASCCFSLHTGRAVPGPRVRERTVGGKVGSHSHKLCLERRTATVKATAPPYHAT
ncbi:hypothetical protein CGRA01v4_08124 [Colletotrichum graminicola]|nr:hypothetical protein CGRA01v4_08124 [Colletotrichum graminicola]